MTERGAAPADSTWAIVLAPCADGWKVRCVRNGAQLADEGGICVSLEEVFADIRDLAELLMQDQLTGELFLGR